MKITRSWLRLATLTAALLFFTACGSSSTPRDFFSLKKDDGGTVWLGITEEEQWTIIPSIETRSDHMLRVRYRDNVLKSITSVAHMYHPVGLTFDMTAPEIKAFYAKDPEVTVTEEPNLLTAAKTIDGTLYYVRVVFYNDGTVKEFNQTVDPSLDELQFTTDRNYYPLD